MTRLNQDKHSVDDENYGDAYDNYGDNYDDLAL